MIPIPYLEWFWMHLVAFRRPAADPLHRKMRDAWKGPNLGASRSRLGLVNGQCISSFGLVHSLITWNANGIEHTNPAIHQPSDEEHR